MSSSSSSDECCKKKKKCHKDKHCKKKCKEICVYAQPVNNIRSCLLTGPAVYNICQNQLSIVNSAPGGVTLVFPQCNVCDGSVQIVKGATSPVPNFITILSGGSYIENPATPGVLPPTTNVTSFIGGIAGEGYTWTFARAINSWVITSRTP